MESKENKIAFLKYHNFYLQEPGSGNVSQKSDEDDFVKVEDLPLKLAVYSEVFCYYLWDCCLEVHTLNICITRTAVRIIQNFDICFFCYKGRFKEENGNRGPNQEFV